MNDSDLATMAVPVIAAGKVARQRANAVASQPTPRVLALNEGMLR